MEKINSIYKKLIESDEYKQSTKSVNYLYLAFALFEEKQSSLNFIFFQKAGLISRIFVVDNGIKAGKEEILEKEPEILDIKKVKIELKDALETAEKVKGESKKKDIFLRTMAILETNNKKPRWNITFFSMSFNTLNVRIDAATGDILEQSYEPLFRWEK
jgi:predicted nucleic-acid-binding protein